MNSHGCLKYEFSILMIFQEFREEDVGELSKVAFFTVTHSGCISHAAC